MSKNMKYFMLYVILPQLIFWSIVGHAFFIGNPTRLVNIKQPTYAKILPKATPKSPKAFRNQMLRIAIIDTGWNPIEGMPDYMYLKLCKSGHFDFNQNKAEVGHTENLHGTVVGAIIAAELRDINYCAVIYNVDVDGRPSLANMIKAFNMASNEGLVAVNVSIEGISHDYLEKRALEKLTSKGTVVFVAAGNRGVNLSEHCSSYPGCYKVPNVVVVGATGIDDYEHRAGYSNYGQEVTVWYPGSILFAGERVNGTSFAAPRALADFVFSFVSLQQLDK